MKSKNKIKVGCTAGVNTVRDISERISKSKKKNNHIRAVRIVEGLKVYMPNKESCLELEKKLNNIGIKTRAGRNCEIDLWSIYIISIPDKLVDTFRMI